MPQIYDLSPTVVFAETGTTVNISEDRRGSLVPVAGSPFTVNETTAKIILSENPLRATATIFNAGTSTIFLQEGSTPAVTSSSYNHPLPPGRLWEPSSNYRFLGSVQAIAATGEAIVHVSQSVVLL